MEIIAHIRTDFPQKFGIPRQSGLVPELRGRIEFEPEYAREEAVRGLEGFSHIWLLWQFEDIERNVAETTAAPAEQSRTAAPTEQSTSTEPATRSKTAALAAEPAEQSATAAPTEQSTSTEPATRSKTAALAAAPAEQSRTAPTTQSSSDGAAAGGKSPSAPSWQPMVRPPLLGGNKQMGVFATRSPFRPNGIGLSCVQLERVEIDASRRPVLHVRGADLRDNTPIYDIKPYLPHTDCHPEAIGGFTESSEWQRLEVDCPADLLERIPAESQAALLDVLAEDPRPARQRVHEHKVFALAFAGFDIRFTVEGNVLSVLEIEQ